MGYNRIKFLVVTLSMRKNVCFINYTGDVNPLRDGSISIDKCFVKRDCIPNLTNHQLKSTLSIDSEYIRGDYYIS